MLEVEGLEVAYDGIVAVRGIDLRVGDGDWVAVVGRNGAGKSSLLNAIAGVAPMRRGSIRFDGREFTAMAAEDRVRAGLVLVPEGRGIFTSLTVRENLVVAAYSRRLGRSRAAAEIDAATGRFPRLAQRLDQRAGSLSGGEQQMLAIARGLLCAPRLLMLDEPSLGLAPRVVDELYAQLADLRRAGIAVLVVEQYVTLALTHSATAYVLDKGSVAIHRGSDELLRSPEILETYLAGNADRTMQPTREGTP